MRKLTSILAIVGALAVGQIAGASDVTRQVVAGPDWGFQGMIWNQSSNRTQYRYTIFNQNGMIEICGVYASRGANVKRVGREAMREAILYVNDQRVFKDMRFFHQASSREMQAELVGAKANCKSTGRPLPRGQVTYRIEIPVTRYRLN